MDAALAAPSTPQILHVFRVLTVFQICNADRDDDPYISRRTEATYTPISQGDSHDSSGLHDP